MKDFLHLSIEYIDSMRYPTFYTFSMRNRGSALVFKNDLLLLSISENHRVRFVQQLLKTLLKQLLFDRENILDTFICVNNRRHEIGYKTSYYKVSANHTFLTPETKIDY